MKARWTLVLIALLVVSGGAEARFEDQILQMDRGHDLQVMVEPQMSYVPASADVRVNVTFANSGRNAATLTRWFVPETDFDEPLFVVSRDGVVVDYLGPIVKRPPPTANDLVVLRPGEQLTISVELSGMYDFSAGGDYTIKYRGASVHLFGPGRSEVATLASPEVSIAVEGRPLGNEGLAPGDGLKVKPVRDTCSAAQKDTLAQAVVTATAMSDAAFSYLANNPADPAGVYHLWFGEISSSRWDTAKSHFDAISNAFHTQTVTFNCKCKQNVYAYVYPNRPYEITVCTVFWTAPDSGFDSKGGTLIHEMSHFIVVAGTNDWAYGTTAAQNLASTDPDRALDNADNHEYFAENAFALP